MEHIELPGYVLDEKVAIAKKYLVPRARKESGIKATNLVIRESALRTLAEEYCKEPGVRDLRNKIDAIYRKAALKLVKDPSSSSKWLERFIGNNSGNSLDRPTKDYCLCI